MVNTGLSRATKQFFLTTTLHGFKYLCSGFYKDRVYWVSCCVASACCAGALCAVLWARFLQVPALLALRPAAFAPPLPSLAICLPPLAVANLFIRHLSQDKKVIRRLTHSFSQILQGKQTQMENLVLLEQLLASRNMTALDALYSNMPPCHEFSKRCRWKKTMVPCIELFHRELTKFGVCCVMQGNILNSHEAADSVFHSSSRQLALVLQCKASFFFGCQLFTKYKGQDFVNQVTLVPGSEYQAQLTFTSVQDGDFEQLVGTPCEPSEAYSRTRCMNTCMERFCGCSNPLRTILENEVNAPPPCQLWQVNCLQTIANSSCQCRPSCHKITTDLSLEDSVMKSVNYTLDPLYEGLDVSTATVVKLVVNEAGSKIFTRQPTETWLTLLSSMGGVFNMFLGVGLFSALEFLFFILVRVPAAMKTFPEMEVPVTHVQTRH